MDNEPDYNGDNPNGWGWTSIPDHFVYRRNGDIVAEISKSMGMWHGWFMGIWVTENWNMGFVFKAVLAKLHEYRY